MSGHDSTLEVEDHVLQSVLLPSSPFPAPQTPGLFCSTSLEDIRDANFYIVTVPTPVDKNNRPDLTPLIKASESVGKVIQKGPMPTRREGAVADPPPAPADGLCRGLRDDHEEGGHRSGGEHLPGRHDVSRGVHAGGHQRAHRGRLQNSEDLRDIFAAIDAADRVAIASESYWPLPGITGVRGLEAELLQQEGG